MRGIATDIDMANAHPTILLYICKKHGIACPELEYYINNRDGCLARFPSRSIGKRLYLIATNNGEPLKGKKLPERLKDYDKEMKRIQTELVGLSEYSELVDSVPEYKQLHNYNGSAINRILCYYENQILQHVIHYINSIGIEIAVLMFDGLMIYGDYYNDTDLLDRITRYVEEQMAGLNMKWTYKQHDDSMKIPDDFDESSCDDYDGVRFATDDDEAASMILEDLKDVLVYDSIAKRVFYKKPPVWICDNIEIENALMCYILKSKICRANDEFKYIPYSQNYNSAENIRKSIMKLIIQQPPVYISHLFHSTTVGRVAFEDGVYDFPQKRFYKWDEIDFPYYTAVYNPLKFPTTRNDDLIRTIRNDVFSPLYGDKIDDALKFFARGLAGYVIDKTWLMYIGSRDCGKSTTNEAFLSAFGSQYVAPFSIHNIMYQRNRRNQDTSVSFYWALELEHARLAISQEIPPPECGMRVNGAMLKKLTSGCDTIVARRNYDRQDTHFKTQCTFAFIGNNSVEIDTPDAWETCFQVSSAIKFKSQEMIDSLRDAGTDELIMQFYRLKDSSLIEKFRNNIEWKESIVWLIIDSFSEKPVAIAPCIDEDTDDPMVAILQNYDITKSDDDMILITDFHTRIPGDKKKLASQLLSMGVTKKKCNRRGPYRDKNCYFGIRLKETESSPYYGDNP
jgi:hypothetical protein